LASQNKRKGTKSSIWRYNQELTAQLADYGLGVVRFESRPFRIFVISFVIYRRYSVLPLSPYPQQSFFFQRFNILTLPAWKCLFGLFVAQPGNRRIVRWGCTLRQPIKRSYFLWTFLR
jgi:hypothetical protein